MSGARRSCIACSFMVDLLPSQVDTPFFARSACHRAGGQVLGANLKCSEFGSGPLSGFRVLFSSGKEVQRLGLAMSRKKMPAIAYLRTSSSTNTGPDKDSDKRQRTAIAAFAKAH